LCGKRGDDQGRKDGNEEEKAETHNTLLVQLRGGLPSERVRFWTCSDGQLLGSGIKMRTHKRVFAGNRELAWKIG
jgi:hypothetical protein